MKRKIASKPEAKAKKKVLHAQNTEKSSWRKITPGALYPLRDRSVCVRQGETIQATAEELGNKLDQFELISGDASSTTTGTSSENAPVIITKNPLDKGTYTIEPVGDDLYNVQSSAGTMMSEEKLSYADAEALKAALEGEA